jgi:hypothetical protein
MSTVTVILSSPIYPRGENDHDTGTFVIPAVKHQGDFTNAIRSAYALRNRDWDVFSHDIGKSLVPVSLTWS